MGGREGGGREGPSKRHTTVSSGLQWEGGRGGEKGLVYNRHTTVSSGLQWEGGRDRRDQSGRTINYCLIRATAGQGHHCLIRATAGGGEREGTS